MTDTIILAAGYGTRLYPLTLNKPKALLEVGGRSIIDRILEKVQAVPGTKKVFVITNDKFYEAFKKWKLASKLSLDIKIINDGTLSNEARLGAIGDIEFVLKKENIKNDLFVLGSDNLFDLDLRDFIEFARAKENASALALFDVKDRKKASKYGICALDADGLVTDFEEKPAEPKSTLAATALYFFPKAKLSKVFEYTAGDLPKDAPGNFIKWLAEEDRVYGYVLSNAWYDIGDISSLEKADLEFTEREGK
jgi:glucose-1-phosphate thymidylyltransferase